MTEHRTISIGGVVINEVNITELANDLHEAFGFDREKGEFDYFSRRYEVKLENDISRSDRNPEILSNSFKTEIVKSVEIVLRTKDCDVRITLTHGSDRLDSRAYISGENTQKVRAITKSFEDWLAKLARQKWYGKPGSWFAAVAMGLLAFWVGIRIVYYASGFGTPVAGYTFGLLAGLMFASSGIVGIKFGEYVRALWPDVELDTGQNYQRRLAAKRKVFRSIASAGVTVLLASLPYLFPLISSEQPNQTPIQPQDTLHQVPPNKPSN